MTQFIKLDNSSLKQLRTVDSRLMSYNIEMTEVTGGTFWKPYTPAQIAGTETFPPIKDMSELPKLMQWYDPIDLTSENLLVLAKALGPVWIRVSGTWANKTYYNFEGKYAPGVIPEGFQNVLQKDQWLKLLDFVKAVDAKLLVSFANCPGIHAADEPWTPDQAKLLFDLSSEYGVPINAIEFMNEPNLLSISGVPEGYTAADFARDQEICNAWVKENYPDCLIVGPSTTDSDAMRMGPDDAKGGGGIADASPTVSTAELMQSYEVPLDVFSYHYYNGISERLASIMPDAHWKSEEAHTDAYLAMAGRCARVYSTMRDKYCPGSQMWVTESGDAGGGGSTWAPTYLDVLRTLNELGDFATVTDGIIFHNTLASSDYGFLQHGSFNPRPNYFAVLLWNRLMGITVYDSGIPHAEGAHVYCHSRKDDKDGCVYLVINNSLTETTTVELPKNAVRYTLSGNGDMRSSVIYLNGNPLVLGENNELPALEGVMQDADNVELAPGTCTFLVL
ncbi:beta-glucuronidase [Oceanobacillus sp. 143]|uniref:Beta-glucuronidase n=1 Tax=Oceanobacillus zhaokaii TaxID=2052660 RepID=A0A345PEN3_9BACI|nr:beta-glucuronidase [Oceanobacillus zhaokaii]AXI08463.1 beta-glucuronidase [Oceanobacillus zhaokaii]QGS68324.1 beta-glucuronidase [Oceanobacillus sp. 143]